MRHPLALAALASSVAARSDASPVAPVAVQPRALTFIGDPEDLIDIPGDDREELPPADPLAPPADVVADGAVTGGGRLQEAAGAHLADPTLAGRASLGFVVKVKRGGVPTGNLEYQSHAARMNVKARSFAWLAVQGATATVAGTATVDGGGDYAFVASVTDGRRAGTGANRARVRLWDRATGAAVLVYDSAASADDAPLAGGTVTIHGR